MHQTQNKLNGFTLLEILLAVGLLTILAAIVIFAINPPRQLAQGRNAQRSVDVNVIMNAIYEYAADHDGQLPGQTSSPTISSTPTELCRSDATSCYNLVQLSELSDNGKYVAAIPTDPRNTSDRGTGYFISKDASVGNRITVSAPSAEIGATISVIR